MCDKCISKLYIYIRVENYTIYTMNVVHSTYHQQPQYLDSLFDHCKFLVTIQNTFAISKTYFQQLFQMFILYGNYRISKNSPKSND
jgi:hypothetical protein